MLLSQHCNADTINQGVSENTVRLIAKDLTKEEMCQLIIRLIPINTDNEDCIGNMLRKGTITSEIFDRIIDEIPTIYYGKKSPPNFPHLKDGSIWLNTD